MLAEAPAEARIAALEAELYAARRCIVLQTEMRTRAEKAAAAVPATSVPSAVKVSSTALLGLPDAATEEYHARWCEAAAENVDLRVETAQLKEQLDEALSVVETVAEIDTLQAEFDGICDSIPEMQEAVCKSLEASLVAKQAREEAEITLQHKENAFGVIREAMEETTRELEASCEEKQAQIELLTQRVSELELSMAHAELSLEQDGETRATMEAAITAHEADIVTLHASLASSMAKAKEAEEDRSMAAASLKTKEAFFQGITAEMKSLKAKLTKQGEDLTAGAVALEAAQQKHSDEKAGLEFDVSSSQDLLEQANAKHASVVKMGMETMSQMEATFKEELGALETQRDGAQGDLKAKTEEASAAGAQLAAALLEVEARESTVAALEARLSHAAEEADDAKDAVAQQGEDAAEMMDCLRQQYEGLVMKREEELTVAADHTTAAAQRLLASEKAANAAMEQVAEAVREKDERARQAKERVGQLDSQLIDVRRELAAARDSHAKAEEAALARYQKEFKTSHAAQASLEQQILSSKSKAEKSVKILEDNLKNAENEVDELDEMVNNAYGILKKHPRVLQENTSLQLLFKALERDNN